MRKAFFIIGILGLFPFMMTSCGKKEFPMPVVSYKSPEIEGIKTQIYPDGVELSWVIPDYTKRLSNYPYCFVVEKAEIGWEEADGCETCFGSGWTSSKCIHPAYPEEARVSDDGRVFWKDSSVLPRHAYRYRIVVKNKENMRTLFTSKTTDVKVYEPLDVIKKIGAKASDKGILVEWLVCPDKCKEYIGNLNFLVERKKGEEPWIVISEANYRDTSLLDSKVEPGGFYDYRVTPYYTKDSITVWGKPAIVAKARAKTKILPPPPERVWVVPGKEGLEVHWIEPFSKNIAGYNVYRKQEDGKIVRLNGKPVVHPPFVDKTALPNVVYSYAISSVSADLSKTEGVTSAWVEIRNVFIKPSK